ncbi:hypothetical protein LOK49_LG08G00870 [Camellia lanceoleosa]|uniref:Uncharacterized protein n=1 Tax=Camellia lanceoleosa TaxID=1840588 RepID=A0ACC0GU15_9ERIC|nr:hypothetical protein LOK49_LG08G00870 [Camellia lanceoleosa]
MFYELEQPAENERTTTVRNGDFNWGLEKRLLIELERKSTKMKTFKDHFLKNLLMELYFALGKHLRGH